MEKRAILAFILSFLIFIAWAQLYKPKPEIPTGDNKVIETQTEGVPESSELQEPDKTVIPEKAAEVKATPEKAVDEKETIVETPLYTAVFTNNGPAIKSFKLKKYRETIDPDSPPVELFLGRELGEDFIYFNFDNPSLLKGKKVKYSTSSESLNLDSDQIHKDLVYDLTYENGISIKQVYRFYPDKYNIDLFIKIINQSNNQLIANIKADIKNLPPEGRSRYYSFVGAALYLNNELEDFKPNKLEEEEKLSGNIDWVALENGYFISAIAPGERKDSNSTFSGILMPSGIVKASYISPSIEIPPFNQASKEFSLLLGPKDIDVLKEFGWNLDGAIHFGWVNVIAKPLHYVLKFLNGFFNNFGVSIIILTILIKILFWPLTQKSQKSMKEMKKIQPLMAKIREKYKDNREQMNKEMMSLYRTYKVNPMSGCLPMLIQIPVFIALYWVLGSAIELRHAPFFLWINDLSAPDRLFSFHFKIPFMNPPYGIPVLTLLMGASMFITQKMQPAVGDPTQAKIMMFLPIMFTVMFINFPSGLVLYWLTQNILSIGQQYLVNKKSD